MTTSTRPAIAVPCGPDWRVTADKPCRRLLGSPMRPCGRPSVAEYLRPHHGSAIGSWWAYCPDHMYGKWVEDGQVMQNVAGLARFKGAADPSEHPAGGAG